MILMFADPQEWWLEISPRIQAEAIGQSQCCTTPSSRRNAYLNALSLGAFLSWVRQDVPDVQVWPEVGNLSSIWEVVNGTAVAMGSTRLILIPTEAIDDSELAVPQEWMDIPSWTADYYLAVQLQPERGYVRVWGYTTHKELKTTSYYDPVDRTYCLDADILTRDLNAFWVTYQFCAAEQTKVAVAPLPEVPSIQAENLLQRLGNTAVIFPRLAVPFELWGALLEREDWRQRLYRARRGEDLSIGAVVRLGEWLQGRLMSPWQTIETLLSSQQIADAWRSTALSSSLQSSPFDVNCIKVLDFGTHPGEEQVALSIGLTSVSETEVSIGIQIRPAGDGLYLPHDIQVRLLDDAGREIGQASAANTETIQLQLNGRRGERFSMEVSSGDRCFR
ncbi:MAG: DUF1822 family protein, partial [Microcystaceae cyanobacterium]